MTHENHVHAAHLLDLRAGLRVQPDHLLAVVTGGFGLGEQAGGVVAGALGLAGAARRRPDVVIGDPHRHRTQLAGEVAVDRGGDQHEQVFIGRAHTEHRLGGDHERPQVEALAHLRGHPGGVDVDQRLHRAEEGLGRQSGHGQAPGRGGEPGGIGLGAEQRDATAGLPVGLEALEDRLPVVQDHRHRVQLQWAVGPDQTPLPAAGPGPADGHHVVGVHPAEPRRLHQRDPLGVRHPMITAYDVEARRLPRPAHRVQRSGVGAGGLG